MTICECLKDKTNAFGFVVVVVVVVVVVFETYSAQEWRSWLVCGLWCERSLVRSPVTSHPCFDFFPFCVALISFKYP